VINGKLYSVSDDGTLRIWRLDAAAAAGLQQTPASKDQRAMSCPLTHVDAPSSPVPATPLPLPLQRHDSVPTF